MSDLLSWSLDRARRQTLSLSAGIPESAGRLQARPGEHHPVWILGHLLLADTYLLHLLSGEALPLEFGHLIACYGPTAPPTTPPASYDPLVDLVARLGDTGSRRLRAVRDLRPSDLERATPDSVLARAQPTIGHHLQTLVWHEGYHSGQLAAWRRSHGFPPIHSAFAPPPAST